MRSVRDISVEGKRVLVRVDYNLPMDDQGRITDDNRIRQTLDLIRHLMEKQAKIILASHLGRPKGGYEKRFSLAPVADHLSGLLGKNVAVASDCIGPEVSDQVAALKNGELLMLENLRFHKEEKSNDAEFARQLAGLCDVYVNDAFAVSHRDQASVTGIVAHVPVAAAGFLLEREMAAFAEAFEKPDRPLVAVIGGAKVSSKLAALENMLNTVDQMIIGGAMANTFLLSRGINTQASLIEADLKETAARILQKAEKKGISLYLPEDLVVADAFSDTARIRTVPLNAVPEGWMVMDIGPRTAETFNQVIDKAKTIVWNGPMGVFEMQPFMAGTCAIAGGIARADAFSVIGGGDTGLAVRECGVKDQVSYVSTGGGAFLHLMEGKPLPGVVALG